MKLAIDGLRADDTFNLITFAGDTHILFPQPVPATKDNLRRAHPNVPSRVEVIRRLIWAAHAKVAAETQDLTG